jgi:integrase
MHQPAGASSTSDIVAAGSAAVELRRLEQEALGYMAASRAANTIRGYRVSWKDFERWCAASRLEALPAAPETVALYLTSLASTRAVGTLQNRLSAIAAAHTEAGLETPTTAAVVRRTWAGIRRTYGVAARGKAPARTRDVRAMIGALDLERTIGVRDRALLLVGFAGALRRSELVALDVDDVVEGDDGLVVTVRRSKTDQEGVGATLGLPFGSDRLTCPVRAVRDWRARSGGSDGPLLRAVDQHGRVADRRLSGQTVAAVVKRTAKLAGLDPARLSAHSLRAGLITSAAEAGVLERQIMDHSRHKSITVMRTYIRDASLFESNAAAAVGL